MHFLHPRLSEQFHQAAHGGSADDAVIDNDHFLAFQHPPDRVEFDLHGQIAKLLLGPDEAAPHIMVADQPDVMAQSALLGIAYGSGVAGIGDSDDDIGGRGRRLPGQGLSEPAAHFIHVGAVNTGVRPGEIDVLEDTVGRLRSGQVGHGPQSILSDGHNFARLNLAQLLGPDEIEGAGLRGEHPGILQFADGQGPPAVRVPGRQQSFR